MQKEREALETWLFREYPDATDFIIIYRPDENTYEHRPTQARWEAWQAAKAQAVPEGFVLVPVETLNEALSWANCASSESWSDAQREEIDKHYEVIEKAMVSSCEP